MSYNDFHDAFNDVLEQLQAKLGVSNAIIRKLEGDELKTVAYFGYGEREANLRIFVGEGITGRCAEENAPVVINDLGIYDGQYIAGISEAQSEACLPMRVSSRLVGTFNIESRTKHNFTPEKLQFLERMAGLLATNVADTQNKAGTKLARALARLDSISKTTESAV